MICDRLELCVDEVLSGKYPEKCGNHSERCIVSSDRRSEIRCEEKKKKYILENSMKNQVISFRMDGGIIVVDASVPDNLNKCDYVFVVHSQEHSAILIELKGVDVPKSLKQIQQTLNLYRDFWNGFAHVYGRIIVASSRPDLKANPGYVNLVKTLKKIYHGNVKIVRQQFREKDIDLSKEQ